MKNLFRFKVRMVSLLSRWKNSKIFVLSVNVNPSLPLFGSIVPTHTCVAALVFFVECLLVVNILLMIYNSDVFYSVVGSLAIYVIYMTLRKFSMSDRPYKSMSFVHFLLIANLYISMGIRASHGFAVAISNQFTSLWVIRERSSQVFKIKPVHTTS
jgi:hypothetical protein